MNPDASQKRCSISSLLSDLADLLRDLCDTVVRLLAFLEDIQDFRLNLLLQAARADILGQDNVGFLFLKTASQSYQYRSMATYLSVNQSSRGGDGQLWNGAHVQ